ncbi:MAG: hypothetical protein JOY73_06435, partial [Actinobacteria bacterium]|nr:hypothetical protein [Actinomycetota bacterium]
MTASGRPDHVQRLEEITDVAFSHLELDALLEAFVRSAPEILGVDTCAIVVREDGGVHAVGTRKGAASTLEVPLTIRGDV